MPDGTLMSNSLARQAAQAPAKPDFDPAAWLASADAAGMRVSVVVNGDEATALFGEPAGPDSDPFQKLRLEGGSKERVELVVAYILSNEPDRVCRAGGAA